MSTELVPLSYVFFLFSLKSESHSANWCVNFLVFFLVLLRRFCFTGIHLGRLWQAVHYMSFLSNPIMKVFIVSTLRAGAGKTSTMVWWNGFNTFGVLVVPFFVGGGGQWVYLRLVCFIYILVVMDTGNRCTCVVVIVENNYKTIFFHHRYVYILLNSFTCFLHVYMFALWSLRLF